MAPLLNRQRSRPAILHRVAKAVQRPYARISAPRKSQLLCAPSSNQLVIDDVRGHANQRQVSSALANNLVPGGKWNEMGKPLQRNAVAVVHMRGNRLGQCDPVRHSPPFHRPQYYYLRVHVCTRCAIIAHSN